MFNDIWSLGIILLNLATGRNPWKSASASDPTFQAYLRDPQNFLPTVLPISAEANAILTRMLEVDWRDRMTIPELRQALDDVESFYSEGVIFEGSMARCPWEAGMEIDSDSSETKHSPIKSQAAELKSRWSDESFSSDIVFASHSAIDSPWVGYPPFAADAFAGRSDAESYYQRRSMDEERRELFTRPQTPPAIQSPCISADSGGSYPVTPNSFDLTFGGRAVLPQRKPLIIDTNCARGPYFRRNDSLESGSPGSSIMQTAVEYPSAVYATESFFGNSIAHPIAVAKSVHLGDSGLMEDKEMTSPTLWVFSTAQVSQVSSMYSSTKNSYTTTHISFDHRSSAPSPEPIDWSDMSSHSEEKEPPKSQQSLSLYMTNAADVFIPIIPPIRPLSPAKKSLETKLKATLFTPLKFFPRYSSGQTLVESMGAGTGSTSSSLVKELDSRSPVAPITSLALCPSPPVSETFSNLQYHWADVSSLNTTKSSPIPIPQAQGSRRKSSAVVVHARHWFLPSKLFASSFGAS